MKPEFSFSLGDFVDEQSDREHLLKISSANWELNILLSKDELSKIPDVVNARWENRNCLRLGDCLGASTWWSLEEHGLSILVGFDEESWQFGVTMPHSVLQNLFSEIDVNKV